MEKISLIGEEWKDIEGFEGVYKISNFGRVYSVKRIITDVNGVNYKIGGKIIKPCVDDKGYLKVNLQNNGNKKNTTVHRLVAMAFIDNPNKLPQINHIDGNKINNRVNNLEWCTNEYNTHHAYINGLQHRHSKRVARLDATTGEIIDEFESVNEACLILGIPKTSAPSISRCCNSKDGYKTCYGFRWKYTSDNFD